MAIFNPKVNPTGDPNYLSYSRPIDVPDTIKPTGQKGNEILPKGAQYEGPRYEGLKHADETGLYAGRAAGLQEEGLGNLIRNSVQVADLALKGADATYKDIIHEGVYEGTSAIRDEYLDNLQKTASGLQKGGTKVADASGGVTPGTAKEALDIIAQDPDKAVPADLENLPHSLGGLTSARANNKLSSTDYYARLDTLARSFRARYPGYKSYIDSEVSKVTGVDPANARIKSLIQDINASVSASSGAANKDMTWLMSKADDHPNIGPIIMKVRSGEWTPARGVAEAMPSISNLAQYKLNREIRGDAKGDQENTARELDVDMTTFANNEGVNSMQNLRARAGLDKDQRVVDIMAKAGRGELTDAEGNQREIKATEWVQFGQLVQADRDTFTANLRKQFNTPYTQGPYKGKSEASIRGGEETEKIIERAAAWHDQALKAIGTKNPGLANYAFSMSKASGEDNVRAIMGTPGVGGALAITKGLYDIGGSDLVSANVKAIYGSTLLNPKNKDAIISQFLKFSQQPSIDPRFARAAAGTTPPGVPTTLRETLETNQKNGGDKQEAAEIMSWPQKILEPTTKDEEKVKMARGTYDPRNAGLISSLERVDQYPAYTKLFSPAMSTEMKKLSDKYDPTGKLWTDYSNRAKGEFAMTLFRQDIAALKEARLPDNLTLAWNDVSNRFTVLNSRKEDVLLSRSLEISPYVKRTFNNLNSGLTSLSGVSKAEGSDTNAFLLKTLMQYGYNPKTDGPPLTMSDSLMRSLIRPQEQKK